MLWCQEWQIHLLVGDKAKLKEYMCKSFRFVYFLALPIMFGLLSISTKFVPIFFGQGYEKVAMLINIISPVVLFIGISNIIGTQYLLPTKKQKSFTISVTAGAIINFLLNTILINKIGSVGACVATVIAEIIVMAFIIKLMHPRAYDPVAVGGGDPSKIPTITNTNANFNFCYVYFNTR